MPVFNERPSYNAKETPEDEFDYAFEVKIRLLQLQYDIEHPPENSDISRERREKEIKASKTWIETGKGEPTTRDKAILGSYPLPPKPQPKPKKPFKQGPRKKPARIIADMIYRSSNNKNLSDRDAWNTIPNNPVFEGMIKDHTKCKASIDSRKKASLTLAPHIAKDFKGLDIVTFNQFRIAWENTKKTQKHPTAKIERDIEIAKTTLIEECNDFNNH